ncbi:hypothetical protein BpHYR1_050443 [Brachionus plicatilis]|uniref:Uncharacterized protein n=1 Tax=Brachionus plicatilis TaxID=10195 RepID=A0A3M7R8D8_BRAPC|nr:hypothetical protein BpHYR1_050443 [Brachionus plicatilis]
MSKNKRKIARRLIKTGKESTFKVIKVQQRRIFVQFENALTEIINAYEKLNDVTGFGLEYF